MQKRSFYGSGDNVYQVMVHEPAPSQAKIPERIIYEIWQHLHFDFSAMKTTEGQQIELVHPGSLNKDSGPDFIGATLQIDGIVWHGTIEMHIYSKTWYSHKHHTDERYNNTILHVTLFQDLHTGTLKRFDGSIIPEIVMYPLLQSSLRTLLVTYAKQLPPRFPCSNQWGHVPMCIKNTWIQSLGYNRIREKKELIAERYLHVPDYEAILHNALFRALGYDKNSDAMAELAKRIPLAISRNLKTSLDLEALHFGVAGLLPSLKEKEQLPADSASYISTLESRFKLLQCTYNIPVMNRNTWKFFRLRPANFPTIRIAQAASWLLPNGLLRHDAIGNLIDVLYNSTTHTDIFDRIQCKASPFWETHYHFKKSATSHSRQLGQRRLEKLYINVIAPLMLFVAEQYNEPKLEDMLRQRLLTLPPEKDQITSLFTRTGFQLTNCIMSQGIHALYSNYCKAVQCMNCKIGDYLLQQDHPT